MDDAAKRKRQFSLKIFLGLAVACLLALPDSALSRDFTRGCRATLIVAPGEPEASQVVFSFTGRATVAMYAGVNQARRWAREHIVECVLEHWAARDASQSPSSCRRVQMLYPSIPQFPNYPFTHLSAELTEALCAANSDVLALSADVRLQIRGDTGCIRGGGYGVDPHEDHLIADDFRFTCPGRIGEGSGFENVEPSPSPHRAPRPPPPSPSPAPAPAPAPPPSPPPVPEPGASFHVLPNIRLPGNDLSMVDVPDGNWQACQHACATNDACRAWTYRNRYRGTESVCLLKRGAGATVPDPCCRSGIRE